MILSRAPLRIPLGVEARICPPTIRNMEVLFSAPPIDKYVYICINRPAADDLIRVKYSRYEQVSTPDEVQHDLLRPALKTGEPGPKHRDYVNGRCSLWHRPRFLRDLLGSSLDRFALRETRDDSQPRSGRTGLPY